jgi:transposase-like protein
MKGKRYTEEFKIEAVKQVTIGGLPLRQNKKNRVSGFFMGGF